jgi:cation transport regulator ChaC
MTATFAQALVDSTGTLGRAYIVPEDYVTKVLDELDFREKGG